MNMVGNFPTLFLLPLVYVLIIGICSIQSSSLLASAQLVHPQPYGVQPQPGQTHSSGYAIGGQPQTYSGAVVQPAQKAVGYGYGADQNTVTQPHTGGAGVKSYGYGRAQNVVTQPGRTSQGYGVLTPTQGYGVQPQPQPQPQGYGAGVITQPQPQPQPQGYGAGVITQPQPQPYGVQPKPQPYGGIHTGPGVVSPWIRDTFKGVQPQPQGYGAGVITQPQPSLMVFSQGLSPYRRAHTGAASVSPSTCFTRWRDCIIVNAQPFFRRSAITEAQCMSECQNQQGGLFRCRSIVYDRANRICDLFAHKGNYFPGKLVRFQGRDYYEFNPLCKRGPPGVTPVPPPSGNVCPIGQSPIYVVQDEIALDANDDIVIPNQSKEQCKAACRAQTSPTGQVFRCGSFDYSSVTRECRITAQKFTGSNLRLVSSPGTFYYELLCISSSVASGIGDEILQEMNMELVGSSDVVITAGNFQDCIKACLEFTEFVCRSAMFFFESNSENCGISRNSKDDPDFAQLFIPAEPDRQVDYFQPVFRRGRRRFRPVSHAGNETEEFDQNLAVEKLPRTVAKTLSTEAEAAVETESANLRFNIPSSLNEDAVSLLGEWTEWTACDRPIGGRRVRHKVCTKPNIKDCQTESQWCDKDEADTVQQSDIIDSPVTLHDEVPCPIGECCSYKGSCLIGLIRLPNHKARWCTRPCGRKL